MSAPLLFFPVLNAVNFSTLGYFKNMLNVRELTNYECPECLKLFYAGCLSGIFSCFITTPGDLVKIVMQADRFNNSGSLTRKIYSSSFEVAKDIWNNYGIKGMYRGLEAMLWRDIPGYGIYYVGKRLFEKFILLLNFNRWYNH